MSSDRAAMTSDLEDHVAPAHRGLLRSRRPKIAAMARNEKLGKRTFIRRFQRATGQAPGTYLQLLRVESARDLLERTTLGVDEIAWRVGYGDSGAFRRVFSKVMGLMPGEYRRRFGFGRPRAVARRPDGSAD